MKYTRNEVELKGDQRVLEQRANKLISQMTLEEKASQLLHESKAIPRLGIPEYNWWNECLHGVARNGKATVFPQAIALAATFDIDLIKRVADAISDEVRAKHYAAVQAGNRGRYAGLTCWTPNINILRDPRWGRGQETYGEDPYLTGEIAVAFVKGLQGDHPHYLKVAACAKHFAVHSGPETQRHEFDAQVSLRDLHETYLPAFKKLVDVGVEAVMGAYNRVNGEPACANTYLMHLLRERWGFKGHFVSDCWAVKDFHEGHHITSRPVDSVALALSKGCDLNCGCTYEHILDAVEQGLLNENVIDASLRRLLMTRLRLGMFVPPESVPFTSISTEVVDCEEHRRLSREAALKSIILLKNDSKILPLPSDTKRIFVTGPNAASVDALIGNYYGINGKLITILEGIADRAPGAMTVEYHPGCLMDGANPNAKSLFTDAAREYDIIIAVMGLSGFYEGEETDAYLSPGIGDRNDISLPSCQIDFLNSMFETGKPVVVILMAGSALDLSAIVDRAAAILWVWYPGQEGGDAVAEVLFGDVSPAGRLPVTFPVSLDQLPDFDDYSMVGRTYRFMQEKPLYPFGYGLSYSEFEYSDIKLSRDSFTSGQTVVASVDVINLGDMDAEEVVQLYITDLDPCQTGPYLQLAGFQRVFIPKGQTERASFELNQEDFCRNDSDGNNYSKFGEFKISIGGCQPGFPLPVKEKTVCFLHQ